jgi:hypothetical protein
MLFTPSRHAIDDGSASRRHSEHEEGESSAVQSNASVPSSCSSIYGHWCVPFYPALEACRADERKCSGTRRIDILWRSKAQGEEGGESKERKVSERQGICNEHEVGRTSACGVDIAMTSIHCLRMLPGYHDSSTHPILSSHM